MPPFVTNLKFWGFVILAVSPLISILLFALGITNRRRSSAIKKWPIAPGTVLSSRVAAFDNGEGGTVYQPRIAYNYTVNGETYASESFDIYDLMGGFHGTPKERAQEVASNYLPGNIVAVYYDPANPEKSVLETDGTGSMALLLFGMAALMLCMGLGGGLALIFSSSFVH